MATMLEKRQNIHKQLKESTEKIKNLEEQLVYTQKLATMGTMSCLVAHEFNNLLVPIINYSELALKSPQDVKLVCKALSKTIKQGNQASEIIKNMLGIARSESQEFEPVKIAEIINECLLCIVRDLEKDRIKVKIEVPADLSAVVVRSHIQHVFLNIIINARQAMLERGGTLTISAKQKNENLLEISFSDTGCGVSDKYLNRIFEPFFTTKRNETIPDRQGTGLGLMVCLKLVEYHNGAINVTSKEGDGTTFVITLPSCKIRD